MKTKTRRPPKPLEKVVQAKCVAVLEAAGCEVFRRNAGMMFGEHKGKRRAIKLGEPGAADLFGALPDTRHFELEIKREDETPTLLQVEILRAMAAKGVPALWVDDAGVLERTVVPELLAGATVEYTDELWTFTVEVKDRKGRKVLGPDGKPLTERVERPGGDFRLVPPGVSVEPAPPIEVIGAKPKRSRRKAVKP